MPSSAGFSSSASHQWSQRWPGSSRSRWTNSVKVSSHELKWSRNAASRTWWTACRSTASGSPSSLRRTSRIVTPSRSHRAGSGTSAASSAVTGRLCWNQVRTWSKPAASSQPCCRSSPAKAPVSICCVSRPRAAPTTRACSSAQSNSSFEQASAHGVSSVSLDHVDEHHPTGRPVVDAAPGADLALRVADHDVLAHPQPRLGDLDQHVVDRGAGPAAPGSLVGTQQVGQAGEDEPVAGVGRLDLPAVEEVLGVREDAVGV